MVERHLLDPHPRPRHTRKDVAAHQPPKISFADLIPCTIQEIGTPTFAPNLAVVSQV
jgi:hypothetical protein